MGVTIIDNTHTVNNSTSKVQADVITDETGILVERLDAIFDAGELRDALTRNGIS